MGNDNTTSVTVTNLSPSPIEYAVVSGTTGQPIVGSLPGHSFGIIELEFTERIGVTVGDQEVTVGPNGMVTYVPAGRSGLVGSFEFGVSDPTV